MEIYRGQYECVKASPPHQQGNLRLDNPVLRNRLVYVLKAARAAYRLWSLAPGLHASDGWNEAGVIE